MMNKLRYMPILIVMLLAACSSGSDDSIQATLPPTAPPPTFAPTATRTPIPTMTATPLPSATPTATPEAFLGGGDDGVEVREQPGTAYNVTRIINGRAPIDLIGRSENAVWIEAIFADGSQGWVRADDIELKMDANTLPVTGTSKEGAQVKADAGGLRLRAMPSDAGGVLLNLDAGQALDVIGRTEDGTWLNVAVSEDVTGWVAAEFVDVFVDTASVNVAQPGDAPASVGDAEVIAEGEGLRVRAEPSLIADVVTTLDSFERVTIIGRTEDSTWLQIRTVDGSTGWVWAAYLRTFVDINSAPVTGEAVVVELPTRGPSSQTGALPSGNVPPPGQVVSGITGTARSIFNTGQSRGNRANVFSKVGDSLTATPYMFGPIGWNAHQLWDYSYLEPVIGYFQNANARDGNSFVNGSMAARPGWTTEIVLDASYADEGICQPGESPLQCEYRVVKPSIALIMLGTNDITFMPADLYRTNLTRIVQISIDNGVIPVLSTIPERENYNVSGYNAIITGIARAYDIPLWDFWSASTGLPNHGLTTDNVHLSAPGDYNSGADFHPDHMGYGYVVRNLTALQVLDALWRQVIVG